MNYSFEEVENAIEQVKVNLFNKEQLKNIIENMKFELQELKELNFERTDYYLFCSNLYNQAKFKLRWSCYNEENQ